MAAPKPQPIAVGKIQHFTGTAYVTDMPQTVTPDALPPTPVLPGDKAQDLITEEENSKMQVCWNRAMCNEMKIPEGYENIAVLIIKWAKDIDQLNSTAEVEEVRKIFDEDFNYVTQVIELDNSTSPQFQLDFQVMNFVGKFNGPHNLMIVYYSGHGSFDEEKEQLILHASNDPDHKPIGFPTQAIWNNAERALIEHAECDMLTIFDACYASNIHKSVQKEDPRTYEMLAATGHDSMTVGPGPKSFTTALVKSLKALLKENRDSPFTTRQLCDKISLQPERRRHQSHLWPRFKRYNRQITLAPLKKSPDERKREFSQDDTRSLLTLSLPLTVARLSNAQIEALARSLSKTVKEVKAPVKRVDWWKLRSSGRTTNFAGLTITRRYAKKWLSKHQIRRSESLVSARSHSRRTIDDAQQTVDDACQTDEEPQARRLKRKETPEMDDAPTSPLKRSKTNDELMQTPTKQHHHPLTPPGGKDMEVNEHL